MVLDKDRAGVRVDLLHEKELEDHIDEENEVDHPVQCEERVQPGGSVRGERANLTRLVIGCIEAKF